MSQKRPDRRVIRTRRLLSNALIQLMLEVGYENITIRALTDRADTGYATFYRHFKSKDDLLKFTLNATLLEAARSSLPLKTKQDEAVAFFRHIQQYRDVYRAGFSIPHDHPVIKSVQDEIVQVVIGVYQAQEGSGVPLEVAANHLITSAGEFIRWFLENEDRYSPEEMARFYIELLIDATFDSSLEFRRHPSEGGDTTFYERLSRVMDAAHNTPV